jgi:hypothetical protein
MTDTDSQGSIDCTQLVVFTRLSVPDPIHRITNQDHSTNQIPDNNKHATRSPNQPG